MADAASNTIAVVPSATRFNLRARGASVAAAGAAFGVALPVTPCRAEVLRERSALWLGPDEWLLLAEDGAAASIAAAIAGAEGARPCSLVDISHRSIGLKLGGPDVTTILSSGCPLDLDPAAFPVGMCTRTIFSRAEIVLWRTAANKFRLEVARSFGPYVRGLLEEACREFAAT